MQPPSDAVRAELEPLLRANTGRLGQVYRVLHHDWSDRRIADELGVDTSNFVSNQRNTVRALLEGWEPRGPSRAVQIGSSVRTLTRGARLSRDATSYVEALLTALTNLSGAPGRSQGGPSLGSPSEETPGRRPRGSLRDAVDDELRRRCSSLIDEIEVGCEVAAVDYAAVGAGQRPLDVVVRLMSGRATPETTIELCRLGRSDLTLEHAVVDWSRDLPIPTATVDQAAGRLAYWSDR